MRLPHVRFPRVPAKKLAVLTAVGVLGSGPIKLLA